MSEEKSMKKSSESQEFEWEIRYNLEEPYRFKATTQVIIYVIALIIWFLLLLIIPIPSYLPRESITPKLILFLLFATVFWTIIVKNRTPLFKSVGNGLLLASVLPTVLFIIEVSLVSNLGANAIVEVVALTTATIVIFIVTIYGHVNPGLPSNIKYFYIGLGGFGTLFFLSMLLFFWAYNSIVFALSMSIIMTLVFVYAVYPEVED